MTCPRHTAEESGLRSRASWCQHRCPRLGGPAAPPHGVPSGLTLCCPVASRQETGRECHSDPCGSGGQPLAVMMALHSAPRSGLRTLAPPAAGAPRKLGRDPALGLLDFCEWVSFLWQRQAPILWEPILGPPAVVGWLGLVEMVPTESPHGLKTPAPGSGRGREVTREGGAAGPCCDREFGGLPACCP